MRQVKQYIAQHDLLQTAQSVIVAVSGGADSVFLLRVLHQLGYPVIAAHCNFHLRGEESNRDEQFVTQLCAELHIPLEIKHFSTTDYAHEHGISIEMAARELRYAWFEEMRIKYNAQAIAVAHHQNDQAETLILNILRGTGTRGLEGMKPKRGHIIRPLLCMTRKDIECACKLNGWDYVTDSTNTDTTIRRNAVRACLNELLQDEQIHHFAELAERMQGYNSLLDTFLADFKTRVLGGQSSRLPIATLKQYEHPEILLYELVRDFGFRDTRGLKQLLKSHSGARIESETHTLLRDHENILLFRKGSLEDNVLRLKHIVRLDYAPKHYPAADELRAVFDAKILDNELTIRHWQAGDRFYPLGMHSSKKLQDFFTDLKLSVKEKENVQILCSGDQIAWVIGYRIDDRFKVTEQCEQMVEVVVSTENLKPKT